MLLSTVFILRPLADGALPLTQGNAIHAWFLNLVHQQAPALASWLHSQERRKPFTTSPLQGALTPPGDIRSCTGGPHVLAARHQSRGRPLCRPPRHRSGATAACAPV